jgi:hypothetical protein
MMSAFSQEQVDQLHVPDYCVHVPPENEVWISRIRKRVNDGTHASIASLVKDFEQLLANCRAYNTPGNGKLGSPCEPHSAPFVVFISLACSPFCSFTVLPRLCGVFSNAQHVNSNEGYETVVGGA